MEAKSQARQSAPASAAPRSIRRERLALEARLLAYRAGWLAKDDIRVKKLERALKTALTVDDDALVRALLRD